MWRQLITSKRLFTSTKVRVFTNHEIVILVVKNYTRENYNFCKFKVCKSVHRRTIQIDHQPNATIFQFIILSFIYRSTCFGRSPAHHKELND